MTDWWTNDPVDDSAGPKRSGFADAIASIESAGDGDYRAVGPMVTRTGDRALGRYQVMGQNIRPWSREVLGREVTPQQFMADPKLQDAIFEGKFGQYVQKYGPEGAAKAWFAGEDGMNNPNARDQLGTTVSAYAQKFNRAAAPQQAKPAASDNWWDNDPVAPTAGASAVEDGRLNTVTVTPTTSGQPPAASFAERFGSTQLDPPSQPQSRGTGIALEFMNQGSAAGQGTTPNVQAQMPNLISDDTHESDAGELLFRDPKSGQLVPTDQNKHVALRDPADNRIKVFARTADTDEGRLSAGGRILATGMATGAPAARPAIPTPTAAQVTPKASDIFATSKAPYRAFTEEASKIEVPAETAPGLAERLRGALGKANFIPELAQPIYAAAGILEKGGVNTLDALQNVKRVIGRGFDSPDKNIRNAAAVASKEIAKIIREVSPTAAQNLKTADDIHSTARAVRDLQQKSSVADLRKGRAGYGGNAVNSMRQVLSPIVEQAIKGRQTPYKPNEIEAMRQIVEGTTGTNVLRLAGQFSPTSGLGALRSAGAGGAVMAADFSGTLAVAIPAIGAASNKLATVMTGKQIDRLKELVAKRSPAYAEAVKRSVDRYEKAQLEFVSKPSPGKLAAYLSASRALSSGLTRDGISISSGDLMRALQGPVASRAEDEQQ